MGSLLVGIDLVQISEIGASMERFGARFLERVFTADEIRYCGQTPHAAAQRFAARFAAKEATMKVLRPLDDALPFRSIEVCGSAGSGVELVLHDHAKALAARAGITSLALSLSHEADYATAVVVAQVAGHADSAPRSRLAAARSAGGDQVPGAPGRRSRAARTSARRTYRKKSGSER